MAYHHIVRRGLGAAGSSAGAFSPEEAAQKIAAFASVAKQEANRAFDATLLGQAVDRERADDIIMSTAQLANALKAKTAGVYSFVKDRATAKSAIDNAMAKVASILPQIKDIGNVATVQAAANAAKTAIDKVVVPTQTSTASSTIVTTTLPTLPPEPPSSGFSMPNIPPFAFVMFAAAAAILLIPSKKRSNPANIVKTKRDERLWKMAKEAAERQGRSDYRYIVGTFKRMKANKMRRSV